MTDAVAKAFQVNAGSPGILSVSGVLSFETAAAVWHSLQSALAGGTVKQLDLAGVRHSDSAGLACVLACAAAASERGQSMQVLHMPSGMQRLAQVCEVERLIG